MSSLTVGARLKKLRLEKGFTLEEVNKKTKIHLNILKCIEEDNLINVNPVYIKGFIKIYSKFLGADPNDFLEGVKETKPAAQVKPKNENKHDSFLKNASLKLRSFKPHINLKPVLAACGAVIALVLLFNIGKAIITKIRSLPKKAKVSAVSAPAKAVKKQEPANLKNAKPPAAAPVVSVIRLAIRAKENCYISLKADGKVQFQGILKKGRFENWQAKDKFELSLGNAGAVDLEINGKLITNLGKRGRALKDILITKEGLSVGN